MQIKIQDRFQATLEGLISKNSLGSTVYIGDLEFILHAEDPTSDLNYSVLLTQADNFTTSELLRLNKIRVFEIILESELFKVKEAVERIADQVKRQEQINFVKSEIQKKRKELESLNEKLNFESEKQIVSLEQSHAEETQKNIKEKNLLHFLDFVQSESTHEDFFNLLIKFIWKDLKKIGRLFQIGFSFKTFSEKSTLFTYDGLNVQSYTVALDFSKSPQAIAAQMATAWGRPVGKILVWELSELSRVGHLFIELIDQQISLSALESYVKERLNGLSLYLDRWMIEKEYEVIVDRWKRTFKSFSGYVHAIDENFNIFQSNYMDEKLLVRNEKCYQILAQKTERCPDCPIYQKNQSDFILKTGLRVKTYISEFNYNQKKYFFVIYEDITQMHILKGQMIHTEKMSALGRLGNHLAHELNNPLTGIKSYTQALLEDQNMNLAASLKSDLNEILKATIRSQNIIKNFINFSQKSISILEKVVFLDILQNAITLLKSVLRSHRLFIDVKQTMVYANSHDLQQVIFNLIKNACQAMLRPGTIKIFEEQRQDKVYFHIEDTGPGFSEEILKNIFEPFMTTKEKGEGTGLGLYLSQKLMMNMNAQIEVRNLVNNGARITLIFDKI